MKRIAGNLKNPWYLGMAIFGSIPLAIATMFLGAVTTLDNERIFFEIAVLAFVIAGVRGRVRPLLIFFGGVFAAPGHVQGIFVNIGAVDFHVIFRQRWAQQLRNQDGQRVRLFPGGATRNPYADGLVGQAESR